MFPFKLVELYWYKSHISYLTEVQVRLLSFYSFTPTFSFSHFNSLRFFFAMPDKPKENSRKIEKAEERGEIPQLPAS